MNRCDTGLYSDETWAQFEAIGFEMLILIPIVFQ